jgi:outer membrane protein insertion porin family
VASGKWFTTISVCLVSAFLIPAYAQSRPVSKKIANSASSWKLIVVKVTGSQRYSPEEIIAASGLQVGQTVSDDDFKKATERLGQTGAFANTAYAFDYSPEGAKLELQVSDSEQFVPAHFENFVWFSDQELSDKLRERVPLFKNGELPVGGDLADQVSDALQAILIERKVQGKADYLREAKENGPIQSFLFSVTGHKVQIGNLEFRGAQAPELPLLQAAGKKLQGREYKLLAIQYEVQLSFLPIYLQHGYLKVNFGPYQTKIVNDGEQETVVDVTVPVSPGGQYKLIDTRLFGDTAIPPEQIRALIRLKMGEVVDAVQLSDDLKAAAKLYGTKGYMAATFDTVPELNDSDMTVAYTIKVTQGPVYTMGELEIRGLDSRTKERMILYWKMLEGDVYDSSYVGRFLKESAKELPPDAKWKISPHEAVNEDGTVDVSLTYETR